MIEEGMKNVRHVESSVKGVPHSDGLACHHSRHRRLRDQEGGGGWVGWVFGAVGVDRGGERDEAKEGSKHKKGHI